jgi:hypothetical protein
VSTSVVLGLASAGKGTDAAVTTDSAVRHVPDGYDGARTEVGSGMRERQPEDRLRVVIAGNIYVKRALVRRFLEDDGFQVVAETLTASELLALPEIEQADAIVVDADLLNGSIDPLRAVAPDAAIVVFTSGGTDARTQPPGADAYLEKGVGLASLTALLQSLLSEASPSLPGFQWGEPPRAQPSERRVLAGLGGVAAAIVLTAVAALAVFGGVGPSPSPTPATPTSRSPNATATLAPSAIELAMADLRELHDALAGDNTVEARLALDRLGLELRDARDAGFSISTFEAAVSRLLQPMLADVAPSLLDDLRGLLGQYLDFSTITGGSTAGGSDAGGNGIVGGVTAGSSASEATSGGATTGGAIGTGDTGTGGGGGNGGGTGGGGGNGGGGGGTGGGGSGGGGTGDGTSQGAEDEGPAGGVHGNGHHYGWTNKPPTGGWHGTKPHPQGGAEPHSQGGGHAHVEGDGKTHAQDGDEPQAQDGDELPSSDAGESHPGSSGHEHVK